MPGDRLSDDAATTGPPARGARAAIALLAAAALVDELLLTRVFSATLYYDFAFYTVSIALLGGAAGAAFVQLLRARLSAVTPEALLSGLAAAGAVAFPGSVVLACNFPFTFGAGGPDGTFCLVTYPVLALPFAIAGAACAIGLDRLPRPGRAYAADLLGAALGSAAFVPVFDALGGPRTTFLSGAIAALGALATGRRATRLAGAALLVACVALLDTGAELVRPKYRLGTKVESAPIDRWCALGEVRVEPEMTASAPFGWGLSPVYRPKKGIDQKRVEIDSGALTVLTRFDGDFASVDHLRFDLTNLVHHARPRARTLILGAGAGRDILSALAFGDGEVTAVEVNPVLVSLLEKDEADFTGGLVRRPGVRLVHEEARTFLARDDARYDIVHLSLTDTAAATAAGAFGFVESGLYTVEAVETMLAHLEERGVVSLSRWWYGGPTDEPLQGHRLVAVVAEALRRSGVASPAKNVVVARTPEEGRSARSGDALVTVLASRSPLADEDVERLEEAARALRFGIVASPRRCADPVVAALLDPRGDLPATTYELRPPTDDWPFFFQGRSIGEALAHPTLHEGGQGGFNLRAIDVLFRTLLLSCGLAALFVVAPVFFAAERRAGGPRPAPLLLFTVLGLAFVLVELAFVGRLQLYVGQPARALAIVLGGLLASSGCGSALAARLPSRSAPFVLAGLAVAIGATAAGAGPLLAATQSLSLAVRELLALAVVAPAGLLMGMPVPLATLATREREDSWLPFYWGANGAASVAGTSLATASTLAWGCRATLLAGAVAYLVAAALGWTLCRKLAGAPAARLPSKT